MEKFWWHPRFMAKCSNHHWLLWGEPGCHCASCRTRPLERSRHGMELMKLKRIAIEGDCFVMHECLHSNLLVFLVLIFSWLLETLDWVMSRVNHNLHYGPFGHPLCWCQWISELSSQTTRPYFKTEKSLQLIKTFWESKGVEFTRL